MADLAGRLQITLHRTPEGLDVDIRSSRPVSASVIFVGKTVEETTTGLPALFSICATAQSAACAGACEQARGLTVPPSTAMLRNLLVAAETVREHLWRVLLDWPKFLGADPEGPIMARVMAAFRSLRTALSAGGGPMRPDASVVALDVQAAAACLEELMALGAARLFGQDPLVWLERTQSADRLCAWARVTDTAAARMLHEVESRGWGAYGRNQIPCLPSMLPADELETRLGGMAADDFVTSPDWEGMPAESSPYSRNREQAMVTDLNADYGNGLLPRLAAQLVELASLMVELRRGIEVLKSHTAGRSEAWGEGLPSGVGIAQIEAARGLLVHRAALNGGQVADYRILAPTEWNFHPRGVVAAGLAALPDTDDETLHRVAGLFVTAVDPCVDYALTIV